MKTLMDTSIISNTKEETRVRSPDFNNSLEEEQSLDLSNKNNNSVLSQ
jgi:hypothetical protein